VWLEGFVMFVVFFFFFNDTATTEIYTLSLHDALPILMQQPLQEADLIMTDHVLTVHVLNAHGHLRFLQ